MGGDDEDGVLLVRVTGVGRWEEGRDEGQTGWWVLGLWVSRNWPPRALSPPAAHKDTHGRRYLSRSPAKGVFHSTPALGSGKGQLQLQCIRQQV